MISFEILAGAGKSEKKIKKLKSLTAKTVKGKLESLAHPRLSRETMEACLPGM